ncbi:MAG: sensor histidine kinase [Pirellulaceae bacterium]
MLSRCSIRTKLLLGAAMLLLIVATLSMSGISSVSSYRRLARSISQRAAERPIADNLLRNVDDLNDSFNRIRQSRDLGERALYSSVETRETFRMSFLVVTEHLEAYQKQIDVVQPDGSGIGDNREERETIRKIRRTLERIDQLNNEEDWIFEQVEVDILGSELQELRQLASSLPIHLQKRMQDLRGNVRGQYHALIGLTWATSILAVVMVGVLVMFFWNWVFRPLRVLIRGSRRVAAGEFDHRIQLQTHDEMAELAAAMNDMTARFQEIRDDLDHQVKQRTKEVLRSEQLASVGFLAAGVAHEINNPLASIAWCAESLESRMHGILYPENQPSKKEADADADADVNVLRRYLRRIQDEAFRCKGITEGLLDFSRIGDIERSEADLCELTQDVIDMVKHLGRYRTKRVNFACRERVRALVNAQEIKQVALNLVVNALDSLESDGVVDVEVRRIGDCADLRVSDNGCGMTEQVLEHLFEPFFTRRRNGQGTGLGLSIAYRIVADHGGVLEAQSPGPGEGSTFHVTLPLVKSDQSNEKVA